MKAVISEPYRDSEEQIYHYLNHFDMGEEIFGAPTRNKIRIFDINGERINIKAFKNPNLVNKIVYRFFRKSKAQRSYEYAQHLLSRNIGTAKPIAFFEEKSFFTVLRSYYVSQQVEYDLTYRELVEQPDFPDHEKILRAFTGFTYNLHENGIEFLDHSPGNTLIQLNRRDCRFFLVDLNRMNFKKMDFESRMKNFARLTPKNEMVKVMAGEYAQLINKSEDEVFEKMWFYTQEFQKKFQRKKKLKKKLKFWKK